MEQPIKLTRNQKKRKKLEERIRQERAQEEVSDASEKVPEPVLMPQTPIFVSTGPLGAILPFKGGETEDAKRWWQTYMFVTKSNGWTQAMCCAQLPLYLQETALTWYSTLSGETRMNLEQIEKDFLTYFYDRGNQSERHRQVAQRVQKANESVKEYALQKKLICQKYNPEMTSKDLAIHFVTGLRDEIRLAIHHRTYETLEEAIKAAEKKELKLKKPANESVHLIDSESVHRIEELEKKFQELEEEKVRFIRKETQIRRSGLRATDGRPICHRCDRVGHVARVCPEKSQPVRYTPSRNQRPQWRFQPYSRPHKFSPQNPRDSRMQTSRRDYHPNQRKDKIFDHQKSQSQSRPQLDVNMKQDQDHVNPQKDNPTINVTYRNSSQQSQT